MLNLNEILHSLSAEQKEQASKIYEIPEALTDELFAQYYWDEKLTRKEDCFRHAVLCWGIPEKIYVDNGAVYCASHFELLLAGIGVRKIHHPAYSAWG